MVFLQLAGLAFFTTLSVTGFMVSAGLGDVADHRSAHKETTPTGGGLGFVAGLGAAIISLSFMGLPDTLHHSFASVFSLIFAVSMLGIIDDIFAIRAWVKFGLLLFICGLGVYLIGPVTRLPFGETTYELPLLLGFLGSLLWVFVVVNAVNFMDGANGFMGTVMAIASLGLFGVSLISGAPGAAILALLNFAILLGFLPYNQRRKALIFSGDIGALCVGFIFAISMLMIVTETQSSTMLYAGPILILPFLTDVLLTLIRRLRRKQNLFSAHNMHLYQRLIRSGANGTGWSHLKVTWLYGFIGLILANIALVCTHMRLLGSTPILPFLTGMLVAGYYMVSRHLPD